MAAYDYEKLAASLNDLRWDLGNYPDIPMEKKDVLIHAAGALQFAALEASGVRATIYLEASAAATRGGESARISIMWKLRDAAADTIAQDPGNSYRVAAIEELLQRMEAKL